MTDTPDETVPDLPELPEEFLGAFDNLDPEALLAAPLGELSLASVAAGRAWYYSNRARIEWADASQQEQVAAGFLAAYRRQGIEPLDARNLLTIMFQTQTTLVNLQVSAGSCGAGPEVIAHTWMHIASAMVHLWHTYEGCAYVVFGEEADPSAFLLTPEGGE